MTDDEFLDLLRCPIDPARAARLAAAAGGLACTRCRVTYPDKDGFPSLMPDEAVLPTGCAAIADLPCRKLPAATPTAPPEVRA
jgi:uncharacterized protein YbaR (Trm112 family)